MCTIRWVSASILFCCLLLSVSAVQAVYSRQIGRVQWHKDPSTTLGRRSYQFWTRSEPQDLALSHYPVKVTRDVAKALTKAPARSSPSVPAKKSPPATPAKPATLKSKPVVPPKPERLKGDDWRPGQIASTGKQQQPKPAPEKPTSASGEANACGRPNDPLAGKGFMAQCKMFLKDRDGYMNDRKTHTLIEKTDKLVKSRTDAQKAAETYANNVNRDWNNANEETVKAATSRQTLYNYGHRHLDTAVKLSSVAANGAGVVSKVVRRNLHRRFTVEDGQKIGVHLPRSIVRSGRFLKYRRDLIHDSYWFKK